MWKVVFTNQIECRQSRKLQTNGWHSLYFLVEAIPGFIKIKCSHRTNNSGKYDDGCCDSTIDDKDSSILTPLIMVPCTALRHALLEWQKNTGVHPTASKSKLKVDWPDRWNEFNYKVDCGKNASCCAAMSRESLTSPGVAHTYTFLMNTWSTLLQSYQQRVYKSTLLTVKRQMQNAENPTPAGVISFEAACVHILFFLTIWPAKGCLRGQRSEALTKTFRLSTLALIMHSIRGCEGAAGITKMKVMTALSAMLSPIPAGDEGPRLNSRGLTWEPVISTGMRAMIAMM